MTISFKVNGKKERVEADSRPHRFCGFSEIF